MLEIRRAQPSDKGRILEISSQIWEGHDFLPYLIDKWLADEDGEFTVAENDSILVGVAKYDKISDTDIWLQGIRVDTNQRNSGFGAEITRYYMEKAKNEGAEILRLSTFGESQESIHMIEKLGFKKDGCFIWSHKDGDQLESAHGGTNVVNILSTATAWHFITLNNAYMMSNGYLSEGWLFRKLSYELLETLIKQNRVFGTIKDGKITAMMIIGEDSHGDGGLAIGYIDGEMSSMKELVDHAMFITRQKNGSYLTCMAVVNDNLLDVLEYNDFHFISDRNRKADVFIYTYKL